MNSDIVNNLLLFASNKQTYQENEILFLEDDVCHQIAYVISGEIIIRSVTRDGNEFVIQVVGVGQFFGDVLLLAETNAYLGNVIARKAATVAFFETDQFIKMLQSSNEILIYYLKHLADKTFRLKQDLKLQGLPTLRDRLLFYFDSESKKQNQRTIVMPITREDLATLLNVRRPSLSRELSRMQKARLINVNRRFITLI